MTEIKHPASELKMLNIRQCLLVFHWIVKTGYIVLGQSDSNNTFIYTTSVMSKFIKSEYKYMHQ